VGLILSDGNYLGVEQNSDYNIFVFDSSGNKVWDKAFIGIPYPTYIEKTDSKFFWMGAG